MEAAARPGPGGCAKRRYPNQGIALKALREIRALGLAHNRQERAYWCDGGCGAWHLTSQPLRAGLELDGEAARNLLAELKTYESADVARAGAFVAAAIRDAGGTVPVAELAARWQRRYPRHAAPEASKSHQTRLRRGLRALAAVGIIGLDEAEQTVVLRDLAGIEMVARNLEILEDRHGLARRPSRWPRSPEVPGHLQAAQDSVIAAGVVGWQRVGKGRPSPNPAPVPPAAPSTVDGAPTRQPLLARLRRWLRDRLRRRVDAID